MTIDQQGEKRDIKWKKQYKRGNPSLNSDKKKEKKNLKWSSSLEGKVSLKGTT